MTPPVDCRFFFGDYHRGKNREECRLLDANPNNRIPWRRKHCDSCPVPGILRETNCPSLALEAQLKRRFPWGASWARVEVTLAVCTEHILELSDPRHCPRCAEREAASAV